MPKKHEPKKEREIKDDMSKKHEPKNNIYDDE
jgi:hypothetical protein